MDRKQRNPGASQKPLSGPISKRLSFLRAIERSKHRGPEIQKTRLSLCVWSITRLDEAWPPFRTTSRLWRRRCARGVWVCAHWFAVEAGRVSGSSRRMISPSASAADWGVRTKLRSKREEEGVGWCGVNADSKMLWNSRDVTGQDRQREGGSDEGNERKGGTGKQTGARGS